MGKIDARELKDMLFARVNVKNSRRSYHWLELTYEEVCDTINKLDSPKP